MTIKQLWCKLRHKHPGRRYATINQIEAAFKSGTTISIEKCLKCGRDIRLYTPHKATNKIKGDL